MPRTTGIWMLSLALAFASAVAAAAAAAADGCPVVDAGGNFYVFGGIHGDFFLGADAYVWTSPLPSDANLTALPGRPPFTAPNLVCLSAFYLNSAYFLNADPASTSTLYQFNFTAQAWSTIATTGTPPDAASLAAVIDHDTCVIYVFDTPNRKMVRLGDANDLNLSHNPKSLPWQDGNFNEVPQPIASSQNYKPTMGQGWISIYFFGVPSTTPGEVWGYRIHYNEWGLEPQGCDSDFPVMHGQTATFFFRNSSESEHDGAPSHIAFVPDDGSAVYVIDSYINMTTKAVGPPLSGTSSLTKYAASFNYLIQFTPDTGEIRFFDFTWLFSGNGVYDGSSWIEATILSNAPAITVGTSSGNTITTAATTSKSNSGTSAVPAVASMLSTLLLML
ncbi:hypothetical protein HDU83_002182 [Entophlyctis luteolus]|nr:hypothetical protein HDU83_002182 [Entophlyctis luteolus]KAJ3387930.1 hypothetical protein HDU84_000393 [Entophlyctis sp. JEL0112]